MRRTGALLAAFVAALVLAVPGWAEAQHVSKGKKAATADAADPNAGASTTPADDALRAPTQDELDALAAGAAALVNDDATGLVPVQRPGGSVGVDLEGRFQSVMVAVKRDGKVEQRCVTSKAEAEALRVPSTTRAKVRPAAPEEK